MTKLDELIAEFLQAVEGGAVPDREQMLRQNPELSAELQEFFEGHDQVFNAVNSADPADRNKLDSPQDSQAETIDVGKPSTVNSGAIEGADSEHRVIGNYEILEEIDRGGMGIVYRAYDPNLNRIVALKMIRTGKLASESDIQRFRAEAQAAAKLDHQGIVPVYEVGTHEAHPYFSMAFIEGSNLDAFHKQKQLSVDEACALIKQVALAIDHAHENGLVHRDLKPANILVDQKGRPRVTDFGLAKSLESDDGLTGTGEILGTINYMAPEQAAARNDQVDRMTDVYSLGAILYWMCTGRPPFETDNPVDTLLRILDSEPTLANQVNPKVPYEVAVICVRCLEKDPKNRYQTAGELAEEISRYLRGEPVEAAKANLVTRFRRWSRREPSLVGHLVGFGLIELVRACNYAITATFFGEPLGEYLRYSFIIGIWVVACFLLQKLQNGFTNGEIVKFAWSAVDIFFLTLILLIVDNPIGPLYVAYPLVIVMSGLFSQVRLVAFTTVFCLISYLIIVVSRSNVAYSHHSFVGLASIIAIGYLTSLLVHRIRVLNRLFE